MDDIQPSAAHRQVEFVDSVKLFFNNYVDFKGRSSRGAYWWFALANIIVSIALTVVDGAMFGFGSVEPLGTVWSLATLIPSIALGVRRLHDIGKSGWWLLIVLTIIGVVLILYWACQPGERSENAYGPDVEAGRA